MDLELDERKQKILDVIIRHYMENGEPVGSRTVSKYTDMNLSSATIRNEMADLEEMGYILQPHTSAGRIPSDKAYRLYVDYLLNKRFGSGDADSDKEKIEIESTKETELIKEDEVLSGDDSRVKNEVMIEKSDQIEQLLQQVARLLAQNTNYTTMVSQPKYSHKKIKFIQLNKMSEEQVLVIIVLDNNQVKNKIVNLDEPVDDNIVSQMNFILNAALNGLDVTEISMAIMQEIKDKAGEYTAFASEILDCISKALMDVESSKVYTSGATNILKYPELSDKDKMMDLLSTFEENQKLQAWADDDTEPKEHNIQVYIGEEAPIDSMKDCSVVTATYKIREGVYGKIGIVGPKRMDYERVVETLENCMQQLDNIFKGSDKKAIEQKDKADDK